MSFMALMPSGSPQRRISEGSFLSTQNVVSQCPMAWAGQFANEDGSPSITLEAVCSYNLHCWYCHVGLPGSNNDLNILDKGPFMFQYVNGAFPSAQYVVNGHTYNLPYFLADGIYPDWTCFVKAISQPQGEKRQLFSALQEARRKDIERLFGVLQARWHILARPSLYWDEQTLQMIWKTCIILHNLIVAEETDANGELASHEYLHDDSAVVFGSRLPVTSLCGLALAFAQYQSVPAYFQLRDDLVEHLWNHRHTL